MVEVSAALIFSGDKFLICQRPAHKARGLKWEFVGGKAEEGETGEDALARECREELGVDIRVGKEFLTVVHRYPDIKIRLKVYTAEIVSGEIQLLEHAAVKWITPEEIPNYDFCPADREVLKKIREVYGKSDGRKNKRLGARGERKAARFLKRHGYKILQRNLRLSMAEIDIVAKKGDVTVFCEVKTRTGDFFGAPREAVDGRRIRRYVAAAGQYIKLHGGQTIRFDVIEVDGRKINHIENAFSG